MRTVSMRMMVLFGLVAAVSACGTSSGADARPGGTPDAAGGACAAPQSSCMTTNLSGCVESNLSGSIAMQACPSTDGTFSSSPCTHTGAVGGCQKIVGPNCNTTWFYPTATTPITAAQVMTICSAQMATFVTP